MEIDTDKMIENALRDGIRDAIKQKFAASYNNPLDKIVEAALTKYGGQFQSLLGDCIQSCMGDVEFRAGVAAAVRDKLAKTLVQRFGGEMEKQINVLKSDPATRARITLAIEEIVKARTTA